MAERKAAAESEADAAGATAPTVGEEVKSGAAAPWAPGSSLAPIAIPGVEAAAERRAGESARGHSLFEAYYQPERVTSFDDLLSRAFAAPLPAVKSKVRADASTDAAGETSGGASRPNAEGIGSPVQTPGLPTPHPTGSAAAEEAGMASELGGETPEWMRRSTLLDEVEHVPLGDLRVRLPKGYQQLDEYRARQAHASQAPVAEQYYSKFLQQAQRLEVGQEKDGDPASDFYASALNPTVL